MVANQPFELTAEMYNMNSLSCSAVVDGGSLTLQLSGTSCTGGRSNNPLIVISSVNCAVPALPEGQYTLNDSARTTLTVGGAESDVQPCGP